MGMLVDVTNEQLLFGNAAVKIIDFVLCKQRNMCIFGGVIVNVPVLFYLKVDSNIFIK